PLSTVCALSLHDALPISRYRGDRVGDAGGLGDDAHVRAGTERATHRGVLGGALVGRHDDAAGRAVGGVVVPVVILHRDEVVDHSRSTTLGPVHLTLGDLGLDVARGAGGDQVDLRGVR